MTDGSTSPALDPLTDRVLAFLAEIGVEVRAQPLPGDTRLPGMTIAGGRLLYDPDRPFYPGDLLHEAGHLAVATAEQRMAEPFQSDLGDEMGAIAWSWAAACHLGVSPEVLFHGDGYDGKSDWFIQLFSSGTYVAVPLLHAYDMAIEARQARPGDPPPYPHMLRWLR